MDKEKVEMALRECLLTDDEMELGPKEWEAMEDPFKEAWDAWDPVPADEDDHPHFHPHGHAHTNGHGHAHTNGHEH